MKHILKVLCCVSFMTLSLQSADIPSRGPVGFEAYDSNKDGIISQDEFNDFKSKRMQSKADANMPMRNAGNAPDFDFFDTNKDGKITPEEHKKGQAKQMQNRPRGGGRAQ